MRNKVALGPSILIIDDEPELVQMVGMHLRMADFNVLAANDGPTGLDMARTHSPALALLDVMMPGMNGFEVCKALRSEPATARISIIFLTSRSEEVDRIVGLELGADDFITKPFSPRELVLRIKAILRRSTTPDASPAQLTSGEIAFNRLTHDVRVRGQHVDLTPTEYKLLKVLMERRGRVQSREALLNEVWGLESSGIDTRTIDTHMRRLREKLGDAADSIETIRGFGYRMVD